MDPITVALEQKGAEDVSAALRDVQDSIAALDAFSAKSGRSASRDRVRAIREEASERRKAAKADAPAARVRESRARAASGLDRALGGNGGRAAVSRASSGPSMSEFAGLASSSMGSLMGTVGKFGAIGGAIALFKTGLDLATSALETFGGFLISDVVKPAFDLETRAQQLANAGGGAMTGKEIEAQSRAAGIAHNMNPAEMLSAAELINDAIGDLKGSFALLDTVGTLAKARGADAGQLAQFAAELKKADPNASAAKISDLLMTQLAQGDKGSVPLKEAARLGGRLTSPAAYLAGDIDVRMAAMGALMQTGRKGFGSTDELATGLENLISEVASRKMVGAEQYLRHENGKVTSIIEDVPSLIAGILAQTGGDAKSIGALGLSDPASKLVKAYVPTFMEAGKGDKGKEAVEQLIRGFMEARTSIDQEKENERKVLQTSGEKWSAAVEQIKNKMLAIMPDVQRLVDGLAKNAPRVGEALLGLTEAFIEFAQVAKEAAQMLADLFGIVINPAKDTLKGGMEKSQQTVVNPLTGQFETIGQDEINKRKAADVFDPLNYKGAGLQLKGVPGSVPQAPELPGAGAPAGPLNFTLPGISSVAPAPEQSSGSAGKGADAALASLDALAPKANKLGLMFDKLAVASNDVARTKPLSQR